MTVHSHLSDPEKYLSPPTAASMAPASADTIYTCPMHPQIRQEGPGTCPICGMTLEPEMSRLGTRTIPNCGTSAGASGGHYRCP